MNMSKKRSTEKLEMSFNDLTIVCKRSFRLVQDLASLNILRSLKALKAEIAPLPELIESPGMV